MDTVQPERCDALSLTALASRSQRDVAAAHEALGLALLKRGKLAETLFYKSV
ncbi:hypothetical protein [Noviherbaspirillum agri]